MALAHGGILQALAELTDCVGTSSSIFSGHSLIVPQSLCQHFIGVAQNEPMASYIHTLEDLLKILASKKKSTFFFLFLIPQKLPQPSTNQVRPQESNIISDWNLNRRLARQQPREAIGYV